MPGYKGPYGLVIGYGPLSEPAIREAIRELAHVFTELENRADSGPIFARRRVGIIETPSVPEREGSASPSRFSRLR